MIKNIHEKHTADMLGGRRWKDQELRLTPESVTSSPLGAGVSSGMHAAGNAGVSVLHSQRVRLTKTVMPSLREKLRRGREDSFAHFPVCFSSLKLLVSVSNLSYQGCGCSP